MDILDVSAIGTILTVFAVGSIFNVDTVFAASSVFALFALFTLLDYLLIPLPISVTASILISAYSIVAQAERSAAFLRNCKR